MPYGPPLYGIFWGHCFLLQIWGVGVVSIVFRVCPTNLCSKLSEGPQSHPSQTSPSAPEHPEPPAPELIPLIWTRLGPEIPLLRIQGKKKAHKRSTQFVTVQRKFL